MRRGDLFGLKRTDPDLDKGGYKVQRPLDFPHGPAQEKEPKRKSPRRSEVMLQEVVVSLKDRKRR